MRRPFSTGLLDGRAQRVLAFLLYHQTFVKASQSSPHGRVASFSFNILPVFKANRLEGKRRERQGTGGNQGAFVRWASRSSALQNFPVAARRSGLSFALMRLFP